MRENIEQRACELAVYIIETHATVRTAAKHFGVSKSTVHKDLSERLPHWNRALYLQVKAAWPRAENIAGTEALPCKAGIFMV